MSGASAEAITRRLGGAWRGNAGSAACPVCQPEFRRDQTALSIRDGDDGRVLLHCFKSGCVFPDIAAAIDLPCMSGEVDPIVKAEAKKRTQAFDVERLKKARSCWDRSKSIAGTKAEAYLRGRSITIELPGTLRFLADEFHGPSGRYHCALVADVEPTGGVHRTFLEKASGKSVGTKISGQSCKMMLGPCSGGAVRLSEGAGPIIVCEVLNVTEN